MRTHAIPLGVIVFALQAATECDVQSVELMLLIMRLASFGAKELLLIPRLYDSS
jgi:hypothetical protein